MSDNARIWPIYLEEAAEFDAICWQSGGIPSMSYLSLYVSDLHMLNSDSEGTNYYTIIGWSLLRSTNDICGTNIAKYAA